MASSDKRQATVFSGSLYRFSGLWASFINGEMVYKELQQRNIAPRYKNDKAGVELDTTWKLLRRGDGGSIYE